MVLWHLAGVNSAIAPLYAWLAGLPGEYRYGDNGKPNWEAELWGFSAYTYCEFCEHRPKAAEQQLTKWPPASEVDTLSECALLASTASRKRLNPVIPSYGNDVAVAHVRPPIGHFSMSWQVE